MNKGRVRDNEQLKWKMTLIGRILAIEGKPYDKERKRVLMGKRAGDLRKILDNLGGQ